MRNSKREIILVIILMFTLGLIFTYPLILHFNTGIPSDPFSGNGIPFLKTGDHLQLYYWFWLLKDNLFGDSHLFSNPYEFNMMGKQVPQGYHMFPFSLLFLIFTPFGNIFAYNATVILSFILAGVSMYLLAKFYTENRVAAFFSALIFTLAPFRLSQMFDGHLNGFIFFFFPLTIYLFEVSIKKTRLIYAVFAGLSIFSLSLMEIHLTYYLFIFLGVYLPFRLLFIVRQNEDKSYSSAINLSSWLNRSSSLYFLVIIGAGVVLVIFSQMRITHQQKIPFFNKTFLLTLSVYPLLFIFLGAFFSSIFSLLTPLKINQAFAVDALSYLPIYLLPIYSVQFVYNVPHLGKVLILLALAMTCVLKIVLLIKYSRGGNHPFSRHLDADFKKITFTMTPIFFFMALSIGYIFYIATALFAGSIAQEGRTFHEISLYSPQIQDIFQRINPFGERYVYLGVIPIVLTLFVLGIILFNIFKKGASIIDKKVKLAFLSFFALTFILSYTLSLGLSFGQISLYKLFYYHFPFFSYPRSPGRMVIVSFFALSILAGYGIKELQTKFKLINREKLFVGISTLLALGILVDYYPFRPIGITTLSQGNEVYRYVKENIKDKILLELPLWPGDSHQSSLYEYYTTIDKVKRVNGYSPVVSKEYIDTVFWPLCSLTLGQIDEKQYYLLNQLGVKYITVHDNREVFPPKVSPYPPLFTVRRFMSSPFVDFITNDKDIYLLKVKDKSPLLSEDERKYLGSSVISNIYDVERLQHNTGTILLDKEIDNKVIWGNAKDDPMGHLTFGPYVFYPQGKYLAYFRLKVGDNKGTEPIVRIEVSSPHHGKETILSKRELRGIDFSEAGRYHDFYLYFDLDEWKRLEFRTYFYKKTNVWVEKIVASFADQKQPGSYFEAEELLGDTGEVIMDPLDSGKKAIFADSIVHSLDYLIYGPYRKYLPGRYRVFYKIKIDQSGSKEEGVSLKDIATIDVTSDSDRHILASRSLNSSDFKSGDYHLIPLDFNLDRENELSFRVKFAKKINIWVDKVKINSLE